MTPETNHIIGRIPVLECLRAQRRKARRLFLLRGAKGLDQIRRAAQAVPIEERSRVELERMTKGATHQGVLLEADPLPVLELADWLARPLPKDAILVILDCIEDPHNFGAIARSAAACGATGLLFAKDRTAPLSATAQKSAAGAMEYLDLIRVTNLARSLSKLKEAGFWVTGLEADSPQLLWEADLSGRVALIIGSEGKGLRHLVRQHCDFQLRIPLQGPITSLNASVSAGIALAECLRQRAK